MAQRVRFDTSPAERDEDVYPAWYLSIRRSQKVPPLVRERLGKQQLCNGILRTSEYIPEYDCLIPRAPAFRLFSQGEVEDLVERLYSKPATQENPKVCNRSHDTHHEKSAAILKFSGQRAVSREDSFLITQRLSKPTVMSVMRERPPQHLKNIEDLEVL